MKNFDIIICVNFFCNVQDILFSKEKNYVLTILLCLYTVCRPTIKETCGVVSHIPTVTYTIIYIYNYKKKKIYIYYYMKHVLIC